MSVSEFDLARRAQPPISRAAARTVVAFVGRKVQVGVVGACQRGPQHGVGYDDADPLLGARGRIAAQVTRQVAHVARHVGEVAVGGGIRVHPVVLQHARHLLAQNAGQSQVPKHGADPKAVRKPGGGCEE